MLRTTLLAVLCCCLGAAPNPPARPTTRPTTRPAAPQRVRDALFGGAIRFLVRADWELASRADDGLSANYVLPEGRGLVGMMVTKQQQAFPMGNVAFKQKMAEAILKAVNDDLTKRKVEVVEPPRLVRDDAFIARIVYRFREGDHDLRAMHAYRPIGVNIVSVTASVQGEDAAGAKAIHDDAATMLLSVTAGTRDPKLMRPVKKKEE